MLPGYKNLSELSNKRILLDCPPIVHRIIDDPIKHKVIPNKEITFNPNDIRRNAPLSVVGIDSRSPVQMNDDVHMPGLLRDDDKVIQLGLPPVSDMEFPEECCVIQKKCDESLTLLGRPHYFRLILVLFIIYFLYIYNDHTRTLLVILLILCLIW